MCSELVRRAGRRMWAGVALCTLRLVRNGVQGRGEPYAPPPSSAPWAESVYKVHIWRWGTTRCLILSLGSRLLAYNAGLFMTRRELRVPGAPRAPTLSRGGDYHRFASHAKGETRIGFSQSSHVLQDIQGLLKT